MARRYRKRYQSFGKTVAFFVSFFVIECVGVGVYYVVLEKWQPATYFCHVI